MALLLPKQEGIVLLSGYSILLQAEIVGRTIGIGHLGHKLAPRPFGSPSLAPPPLVMNNYLLATFATRSKELKPAARVSALSDVLPIFLPVIS